MKVGNLECIAQFVGSFRQFSWNGPLLGSMTDVSLLGGLASLRVSYIGSYCLYILGEGGS